MEQWVQLFKALADETRLRIMGLLMQGELCVCDLMAVLEEPQSKISRHLIYLKHSGLTYGKRVGVWMHYGLKEGADESTDHLVRFLSDELLSLSQSRKDIAKLKQLKRQGGCKSERDATSGNRVAKHSKNERASTGSR